MFMMLVEPSGCLDVGDRKALTSRLGGREGVLMMTGMDGVWPDYFTSRVGCVQSTGCSLLYSGA